MIRAATATDLAGIMAIERASFPDDAWSEAMMAAELASPHGRYVVVEEAGRLIGYGGVRAPEAAPDADIQTIALAESMRGRGRGRALLRALLHAAGDAHDVFLDVRADNPVAQALYASEGFVRIDTRPKYYPGGVDAVVMRLDLPAWRALRAGADGGSAPAGSPVLTSAPFTMLSAATGAVCGPDGCS